MSVLVHSLNCLSDISFRALGTIGDQCRNERKWILRHEPEYDRIPRQVFLLLLQSPYDLFEKEVFLLAM